MNKVDLNIPEEMIFPDYAGNSIANVPATFATMLNIPFEGLPPLRPALWQPLAAGARRIILILIDSLGKNIIRLNSKRFEEILFRADVNGTITSVFPSTTVAALSSLWTGFSPAQHGLVGLRFFFPNYGVLGQMLRYSPNLTKISNMFADAGTEPEDFLEVPGFAEHLTAAGVVTHTFKGREIIYSPLSRMHDRGVTHRQSFVTMAEMFVRLGQLLEQSAGDKLYVNIYWPAVDSLSHVHGPNDPSVTAELRGLFDLFSTYILEGLSPATRRDTVVFITGDHGQVLTSPDEHVSLDDHPELDRLLLMRPNGEPRSPYLYARQGKKEELLNYLQTTLQGEMIAWSAEDAIRAGLLGPLPISPKAEERVGDIIGTMRGGHLLLTSKEREKATRIIGRHGGLSADEMEIPWLGFRLDQ